MKNSVYSGSSSSSLAYKNDIISSFDIFSRKSKGITDAIGLMTIISERVLDVTEEMCLCFIDWQKAFDRVDWTKLLEMLRNIGVNWRERRLICNLYMGQRVKRRLNQGDTTVFRLEEESDRDVACHP